jgi:hypothetical protein
MTPRQELHKFIVEWFGGCWHNGTYQCIKCGWIDDNGVTHFNLNLDTYEGLGWLWRKMRENGDLWIRFYRWFKTTRSENIAYDCYHFFNLIDHPSKFADAVEEFLKGR